MSKIVVNKKTTGRDRRRKGIRKRIYGTDTKPRLSVFRGNRNMYCQVIDDERGVTLASASTGEKGFRDSGQASKTEEARRLGEMIAGRAKENGIQRVVFDRGGYKYHGRVKALAESARENGLIF